MKKLAILTLLSIGMLGAHADQIRGVMENNTSLLTVIGSEAINCDFTDCSLTAGTGFIYYLRNYGVVRFSFYLNNILYKNDATFIVSNGQLAWQFENYGEFCSLQDSNNCLQDYIIEASGENVSVSQI